MFQLLSAVVIYIAAVGINVASLALARDRERTRRQHEMEVASRDAELAAVKAQFQPHFVLNALNSLLALIDRDPAVARTMIVRLADLMKAVFDRIDAGLVPFERELDMVRAYLDVERIRLGSRLTATASRSLRVPLAPPSKFSCPPHAMSPRRLRVLLADDEPLALALMRGYASRDASVEIVWEADSGDALASGLAATKPEVAFVDIRVPGTDVFQVLARAAAEWPPLPAVVFATAFDAYAVRAFDMNAVDYLIKPFSVERFSEALRRVRTQKSGAGADGIGGALRDLGPRPDRVLVPEGRRMVPIATLDIEWIQAEGDYARVHSVASVPVAGTSNGPMALRFARM